MIALLMPTYVDAQVPCSDPGALKQKPLIPNFPQPMYLNDYVVTASD